MLHRNWTEPAKTVRHLPRTGGPIRRKSATIPDYVVTLLQAIREQPNFEKWIFQIEPLPTMDRNQLLDKMAFAFRIEDANSTIAAGFDRLKDRALFKAFYQTLREEKQVAA